MFAIERQNKIKELLYKEKRVDVFELSDLFSVTEATIRRDLDKLEKSGILVKIYGGAVLSDDHVSDSSVLQVNEQTNEEKKMIGRIASQMIENGDAIFLSSGSTCLEIARNIKDKQVTVVTNDLMIGLALKDNVGVKVILTGGDLVPSTTTLVGGFTLQAFKDIYINKSYIGVKGIHLDYGYTVDSYQEVMVFEGVRKISGETIIVADYTKFNRTGFAKLGDMSIAKKVITNIQIPSEYKTYFFEHAVKLYTTFGFE